MRFKFTLFIIFSLLLFGCTTKQPVNGWEEYFCNMNYVNNIYLGILLNNSTINNGNDYSIYFEFDSDMIEELEMKYHINKIAGSGSDFDKALRIMHEFAPRLAHGSTFDNHIDFNSLSILDYSLDKPKNGINCLNKSKILMELCLSQDIYARKVSLYPYNPIDEDNHVVVEIYSNELEKWIMLDPSSNTYCQNKNGDPMSLLEIRDNLISKLPFTIISQEQIDDPIYLETYLTKNLIFLVYDSINGFGNNNDNIRYYLLPQNFDINKWYNTKYPDRKEYYENNIFKLISIDSITKSPIALNN